MTHSFPTRRSSDLGVLDYMLITNNEFWLSMPFAVRSELEGIILEVTQAVNREAAAVNRRDRERILASGSSQLITLTPRSEEHTSELQSLMRISYAVFCLKKKSRPNIRKITV